MSALRSLSDAALAARLPELVQAERHAMVDLIEHLVEVERRRLYLTTRAATLYRYCIKVLGYDEHAALKRHRVAKLALRLPQVLDGQAHNLENARRVFGESFVDAKVDAKAFLARVDVVDIAPAAEHRIDTSSQVLSSLCNLGFRRLDASVAIGRALAVESALDAEQLLRRCLELLVARAG